MENLDEKRERLSDAGRLGGLAKAQKHQGRSDAVASLKHRQSKAVANRSEERRGEERREEENKEDTLSSAKPDANGSVPKEALKEIIDYLNEQTGKTFKTTTADTIHHISARWKEGRRVADFKTVVDIKVKTWCGDMERYLRPATLFGPKFEAYLNEIPAQRVDNHAACPDCGDRLVAGHCMRCYPIGVKGENE